MINLDMQQETSKTNTCENHVLAALTTITN